MTRKTPPRRTARPTPKQRVPRWAVIVGVVLALGLIAYLVFQPRDSGFRPDFSGERAFVHVERQVAFGPRLPGSEAHRQARAYFLDTLGAHADRVVEQPFTYTTPDSVHTFTGTNIVASFNLEPERGRRVLLAAHYDSRPTADQDPDPARRSEPVPGANDGASGVAVLLELARHLGQHPLSIGVDIVLFDLEDLGEADRTDSTGVPFAIGSEMFVAANPQYRPAWGVLLDMVGDANLRIPQEAYSLRYARPVLERVWAAAERVGAASFLDVLGPAVYDDHVPFLRQGIPVVDLVHAPFPPYWHTTADTPDKLSPASLEEVGTVLIELLYGG